MNKYKQTAPEQALPKSLDSAKAVVPKQSCKPPGAGFNQPSFG